MSTTTQSEDKNAYIASLGFPVLVIIGGIIGYVFWEPVQQISSWTTPLLGIIMFGMGLTMKASDFVLVVKRPLPVLIGVIAQYVIMPAIAVFVVWVMQLPPEIAAGVILVGCAPGGTSSNVVSYLARGDVALSVTMTSVSTLLAPIMTPLLTQWLAGQYMPLNGAAMAWSIVQVVLVPIAAGLLVSALLPKLVARFVPAMPWISVVAISTIVAIVVSGSRDVILTAGLTVVIAVIVHNGFGLRVGLGDWQGHRPAPSFSTHDGRGNRHAEFRPCCFLGHPVHVAACCASCRSVLGVA